MEEGKKEMNLYLLQQDINRDYDTYDSMVVIAENEEQARTLSPDSWLKTDDSSRRWGNANLIPAYTNKELEWCDGWVGMTQQDKIKITYLGKADKQYKKPMIVMTSFNAG